MTFRKTLIVLGILSLVVLVGSTGIWAAQSASDFYKGKTITIVEGFGAGSDFDRQARLIAPFLREATGARVVTVENKSGAAGLIARNYLFNNAKNNGLTIMLDHGPRNIQNYLFGTAGVNYNWKEFVWIGKLVEENLVLAVDKNLDSTKLEDLAGQSLFMGVSRPFYEPLFVEALGLSEFKLVPGYQNPNERVIGIARGEIKATVGNTFSFTESFDTIKPIVISFRHKDYPGVPTLRELAPANKIEWVDYVEAFETVQYSFIAPPGTPVDRAQFLEDCLHKIYDNPEFEKALAAQWLDKTNTFVGSKEINQVTKSLADMSPEEVKVLQNVIEEKYMILK